MFYTYLHKRSDDGSIFYVGKGRGKRAWDRTRSRSAYWRRTVEKHGLEVVIAATWATEAEAFIHETFLIECLRGIGTRLTNMTDGGEGQSGRVTTPETRAKLSAAGKGRIVSRETRAKMAAARTGKTLSAKTREKMSKSLRGRPGTWLGRAHTDEARARMSVAHQGKVLSAEHRQKISDAMRARRARNVADT